MAHEIIEFGTSSRRFSMSDVAVAFAIMAHLGLQWVNSSASKDPKLLGLLNEWLEKLRTTWAFFDPEFDGYVAGAPERHQALLALIDNCLAGIAAFGQHVPASFLNELLALRGQAAIQTPYETARVRETIQQIRGLIQGEAIAR